VLMGSAPMKTPAEQAPPDYSPETRSETSRCPNKTLQTPAQDSPERRPGNCASGEDVVPRLPVFVRMRHLREAGIVDSWQQLRRLVAEYGFPTGVLLSPNVRAWDKAEVERWLANRPVQRKEIPRSPNRHPPRRRPAVPIIDIPKRDASADLAVRKK